MREHVSFGNEREQWFVLVLLIRAVQSEVSHVICTVRFLEYVIHMWFGLEIFGRAGRLQAEFSSPYYIWMACPKNLTGADHM